jgi:hypothetical protein
VATLLPANKAGVVLIFDVHLVVGGAYTPEAWKRTRNRRRRSGNWSSGSRRSRCRLRRVAMMRSGWSSSSPIRRRQSGRSCESKDSKTNENAFGHGRLLEIATKETRPGVRDRGKPGRAFSPPWLCAKLVAVRGRNVGVFRRQCGARIDRWLLLRDSDTMRVHSPLATRGGSGGFLTKPFE